MTVAYQMMRWQIALESGLVDQQLEFSELGATKPNAGSSGKGPDFTHTHTPI